jgi:hypothetical protein
MRFSWRRATRTFIVVVTLATIAVAVLVGRDRTEHRNNVVTARPLVSPVSSCTAARQTQAPALCSTARP